MIDPVEFGKHIAALIKEATAPLISRVDALEKQLSSIPAGKDGSDGRNGADGKDCDMDAVMARIDELIKAIPAPKDGKDAEPVSEKAIADAVAALFERRFSDLSISWERQARDEAQRAIDKMPTPKDGKDAAPIETFDIVQNERTISVKLGDMERSFRIDTILDRGVWEQKSYEKGDAVSYNSSLWIAQQDTEDAPGTSKAWRLAVRKGRDGMDLRDTASKHNKADGVRL